MKFSAAAAVLATVASVATAFVNPLEPWGESVWVPNSVVTLTWNDDNTTMPALTANPKVDIFFMTGSDLNMTKLTTIAEDVDVNKVRALNWTVPVVEPAGKIYFLQFETKDKTGMAWATRFHVTDATGKKSTLDPGRPNGGQGKIVSLGVQPTTAAPAASSGVPTASGSAADPKATAAGGKSAASSLSASSVVSAAAAVVLGAVALAF